MLADPADRLVLWVSESDMHVPWRRVRRHARGCSAELAARVVAPASGRAMELYTNQPGAQLYTSVLLPWWTNQPGAQLHTSVRVLVTFMIQRPAVRAVSRRRAFIAFVQVMRLSMPHVTNRMFQYGTVGVPLQHHREHQGHVWLASVACYR